MAGVMRVAWSAILELADGHEERDVTLWVKVPGADRGWVFGEVKWAAWEASEPWDNTCSLQLHTSDTAQGPVVKLEEPRRAGEPGADRGDYPLPAGLGAAVQRADAVAPTGGHRRVPVGRAVGMDRVAGG